MQCGQNVQLLNVNCWCITWPVGFKRSKVQNKRLLPVQPLTYTEVPETTKHFTSFFACVLFHILCDTLVLTIHFILSPTFCTLPLSHYISARSCTDISMSLYSFLCLQCRRVWKTKLLIAQFKIIKNNNLRAVGYPVSPSATGYDYHCCQLYWRNSFLLL